MANYLMLTVDTEALPNRAKDNHVDRLILGIHENGTAGVKEMASITSEFVGSMVFFVDICGALNEKNKVLEIARWLEQHGQDVELHFLGKPSNKETCGRIINYGSSMGGYAAFLFSCYLEPDLCFCECPQANLMKYKYSKEYLETCDGLGLKDIPSLISSLPSNERAKQKALLESNIVQKFDLSFSAILRNHHPKFRSLIHFYSLDRLHLTSFENEIHSLTDEELKTFNYQLVIENDIENQLFTHQAMPKEKVLEIFHRYLK